MDYSKDLFSRFDREPAEPTCHELRLASAISGNSPYRVFQALNSFAIALSGEPFSAATTDRVRAALYLFLSDVAAGRDCTLPVFLPADKGFLKVKVTSTSDKPTVSLELGPSTSFWVYFLGRRLITGLTVPLIYIDPPQYSFIPAPGMASAAATSLVDSIPVSSHTATGATFTDPEWDAAISAAPTRLEQLAALAIYAGSAHGLLAVLRHIAVHLIPGYSCVDTVDADLERLASRIQAIHHALSTKTNTHVRLDLPGGVGDLDLCSFTLGNIPHVRLSIRTLPYPNRVGYMWDDILTELPVPLPSLPGGILALISSEHHECAAQFTRDERVPLRIEHALQLLVLCGDESLLRMAIDDLVACRRHAAPATDPQLIQDLFANIVLLCEPRPIPFAGAAAGPVQQGSGCTAEGQPDRSGTLVSPGLIATVAARLHTLRKHTPFHRAVVQPG